MKEMQWRKSELGGLELYIDEGDGWVLYTRSSISVPDSTIPGASRGFPTFQNGLKQGYKVLDVNGNVVT